MLVVKACGIWLLMVVAAIINGLLRDKILVQLLGNQLALPTSGLLLSMLIFMISYITIPWLGNSVAINYIGVGLLWLVLTLLFELGFGHYLLGKSWSELLQVFNLAKGDLFLLVLLVSAVSPYIVAKLHQLI